MLTNIFENRNKKVTSILKLGDYLSRSLRNNVELFDLRDSTVTFVTENNQIIRGSISLNEGNISLTDIEVTPATLFSEGKHFDEFVSQKAMAFLKNLNNSDFPSTSCSFTDLLGLWETRLKFDRVVARLNAKKAKFTEKLSITNESEYKKFVELRKELVEFLKENKDTILQVPEIKNSIRFMNLVSTAFNFPKLTEQDLGDKGSYEIKSGLNESIYEIICKQELIKRELLEAKTNFDGAWASNTTVSKLASLVFESDDDVVAQALGEAIMEVPYIALSTKKSLTQAFSKALSMDNDSTISTSDIKAFSAKVYEMKKPIRSHLAKSLNEDYGISTQNLKEVPTFKDLVKTQVVIFETLGKLSKKDSIQQGVLKEMSRMLSKKSGSESLDVCEDIYSIFNEAGYDKLLTEMHLMDYLDFDRVASDLGQIGDILRMLKKQTGVEPGMEEPGMEQPGMEEPGMVGGEQPGVGVGPEVDQDQYGSEEMLDEPGEEEMGTGLAGGDDDMDEPSMDPEMAAAEADAEVEAGAEPGMEEDPTEVDKEDLLGNLSKLDALIQDLAAEITGSEEEGMEDGEGFGEEEFGEEGGEEFGEEGGEEFGGEDGEEELDIDGDGDGDVDVEKEEPEEEDLKVKKKSKKKPPFK